MDQSLNPVQKRRLVNSITVAFALLSVYLVALGLNTFKENAYIGHGVYPVNTITVSGKGEIFAIPDTGSFSFSVVESGKTVGEAQDLATKKINSAIDAIKAMGVDEKDIKTIGYYSSPKYDYSSGVCTPGQSGGVAVGAPQNSSMPIYCPPGKQILTGYEVNQTISVKVRKTADAGAILTKVGSLGVQNISGLDFVIEDMDSVNAQARDKAIQDAKNKAQVLAKSLGVKLGKIVSYNEDGGQPIYYAMGASMDSKAIAPQASTPPQVPVGQNDIISNVTLTYEVL
jgi:uncharacterized protein YggE